MEAECNGELYLGSGAKLVGRLLAEKSVNRRSDQEGGGDHLRDTTILIKVAD